VEHDGVELCKTGLVIVYGKQLGLGYLLLGCSSSGFLVLVLASASNHFSFIVGATGLNCQVKDRLLLVRVQGW
jgi:hypothetical protein